MSDVIHLLPDSVANQIAAGEVIQRPASVLKELVENSIDAGATHIQILIKDAGRTLIQIVDNGKGMSETDARMAFERHATSKISDANDLFSLRTMGFRGEALASIAAVAQIEMKTRREEDELGILIEIAGSRVFKQESVQCPVGTSFMIKNLFFNVPARRRFLKTDNVEKTHLLNEFYRIALVYPHISFSYTDGQDEVFQLPISNTKLRIENIFGKISKKRWEQQLLPIETTTTLVKIYGYVGKPEFAQKSANQYFFVNNRYMRHPYFHKAVMMAYDKMLTPGENPNYFIYFDIDPQTIDINIHPTKTEIKFENEQAIWPILSATIKETLGKFNIVPSIDFDTEGVPEIPVNQPTSDVRPPQTSFNPNYNPFSQSSTYKRPSLDWEKLYDGFDKSTAKKEHTANWRYEETGSDESPQASLTFEDSHTGESQQSHQAENFQLKNKYILTGVKSGLLVINQQRAHFRILFDEFMKQFEQKQAASQQLLFPETLVLEEEDKLVFEQIEPSLKNAGFEISKEKDNTYSINGIPPRIEVGNVIKLIQNVLASAKSAVDDPTHQIQEIIALSLAEATSLKTGQNLSNEEMKDLIDRLFASSNHNYTPNGKKILSILTYEELENRLK
ncbi:DNA mismatch repair endonuclease MutL [Paludibacter sp. 221]|uniref:DNA mismatch repair endonuclease MutL n=1 Tax=Paludibacter sp. 221 TaxID=2302939 RepID=UPI0013D229AF|nr:DNA mismatch repair endonuclease MutL [Paludibacter sp. 221]NDV46559.1 DNA mismatch repair endonuclease MutL [Paludibacter sp. 221]